MRASAGQDTADWSQVSGFIANAMGLHFPRERWTDLQRGLAGAAVELGFADVEACAGWLLSAPPTKAQLQVLSGHLTIGETYFFREKQTFEIFADRLLPELIQSRRGRDQRLRLWSAGCCTGEEAYSLAILVHQLLPDLADWQVTILATDINPLFLRKAVAAAYSEWSFRDTPAGFKARHFHRRKDGRQVVMPTIKKMVTFEHQNLVEDGDPSLATETNAMDVIFCRNVLMYFTPAQARKVIGNLHRALVDGGWLAVSPSEASRELFPEFTARNFPGAILFEKNGAKVSSAEARSVGFQPAVSPISNRPDADLPRNGESVAQPAGRKPATQQTGSLRYEEPSPYAVAVSRYEQGRYAEAADLLLALVAGHTPESPVFSLLARALANQGRLAEALTWCDRWIAADKLDSAGHYLRAVVLLEQGEPAEARRSLQRAVYLHPDFVLAHFALGNLARSHDKHGEADKHFANALHLLARLPPNDPLPESDGLTAGRLTETISALREEGANPSTHPLIQ